MKADITMTIKKRLFLSNILMLVIPALVSLMMILGSLFLFLNAFYKQALDETVEEYESLEYVYDILIKQSKDLLSGKKEVEDSVLYHTMEKYLDSQKMKLEIYNDSAQTVCSIGSRETDKTEFLLVSTMENLGGKGSITIDGKSLYGEEILVNERAYQVWIYSGTEVQESQFNENLVKIILAVIFVMIVIAVLITNRFLTKFIFQKMETPLNILTDGVRQIRDGNLDYRIEYPENDEFKAVCENFNDMAQRLKESVEAAQRDEQSRKELIAGISHDLRTPLTSIKAYIEGLLEGIAATPQMQQKYMQTILTKANDIDRMVDKLFLFSKLDLGECPFYPEKLSIRQEIASVVSANEGDYREKGMNIICEDIPSNLFVYADSVQLRSAVTNILENSLKYKDEDNVTVMIRCENSSDYVKLMIEDNGPGVAEEVLPKLFDVFYRSDSSRSNPNKGSGLGLAITAKILERFGGSIHAENVQPKGLRLVMEIPKEDKHEQNSDY